MKIKKGDQVIVTAGKDKGKKGAVEKVFPRLGKVLVSGVNLYKKHVKARGKNQPGGIIDISKPISVSNVMFICPKCGLPTRVGYRISEEKKQRICKKCREAI